MRNSLKGFSPDQNISYIWTAEGWLYLAVVVDLSSRRIVGWATSNRMKKDLAQIAQGYKSFKAEAA